MGESRFLLINIAVVILLLILFFRIKTKSKPANLRFGPPKLPEKPKSSASNPERNLNCLFQYNGHTWDAHEVLGVPAGCPAEVVREGYESALRKSKDHQSREFIEAAADALRQQGQL